MSFVIQSKNIRIDLKNKIPSQSATGEPIMNLLDETAVTEREDLLRFLCPDNTNYRLDAKHEKASNK